MLDVKPLSVYSSDKIISLKQAVKLISQYKKQGKTVGLSHGGFDLLHPGHVKHFSSAKKLCDLLFVSVTSDKFVSLRKGNDRPIFTDRLRAYMIANLESVDFVVITNFQTGVEVINLLKPSYYIKGPDFIHKTTPGISAERNTIKKINGQMKYTNDPKLSTTAIIDYIQNQLKTKKLLLILDRDGTLILNNDYFGKRKSWQKELKLNNDVISLIAYLQTKFHTTKIVASNQSGVARKLFSERTVNEINNHLDKILKLKGITIENWQFCPFVDKQYAKKHQEIKLNPLFIKSKTFRKPAPGMVFRGLKELKLSFSDFDYIFVIGDRNEDKILAENINAKFLDVKSKPNDILIKKFNRLIS